MTRLPFRYGKIQDFMVVTNESGKFYFLDIPILRRFISDPNGLLKDVKNDLQSKFFLAEDEFVDFTLEESAIKLRTKKSFLLLLLNYILLT